MPLRRKLFVTPIMTVALVLTASLIGGNVKAAEPAEVVKEFHTALLEVMKTAEQTPVGKRYEQLEPVIDKAFNLKFMIRVAAGSRWKKTSDGEKKALAEAFRRMSVGTYASRFNGYSGQTFKTLGIKEGPRKTKLVMTHITSPGDKPVKLTYVMRRFRSDWLIVDVLLDGSISEMAVRVSEYRNVLRSQGSAALTKALNAKADRLVNP